MEQKVLHASAAETATGNSVNSSVYDKLAVFHLDVSAFGGTTPTLDVTIEAHDPVANKWYVVGTFAQVAETTANERVVVDPLPEVEIRVRWVIAGGGGETYTFSIGLVSK